MGTIFELIRDLTNLLFIIAFLFIGASNSLIFLNALIVSKLSLNRDLRNDIIFLTLIQINFLLNIYLAMRGMIENNFVFIISSLFSSFLLIYGVNRLTKEYIKDLKELLN